MTTSLNALSFSDRLSILIFWMVLSGCTGHWVRQDEEGIRTSVDGLLMHGPIRGFLQIPIGGEPGTTSERRPTLKELEIKTVTLVDTTVAMNRNAHTVYGGIRTFQMQSNPTALNRPLISHGKVFPGDEVSSDIGFNWYRFGYRYGIEYLNSGGEVVRLDPIAELMIFNFSYQLESAGQKADRSFMKGTPLLGFRALWSPISRFSVTGEMKGTPIPSMDIAIFSAQVINQLQLFEEDYRGAAFYFGVESQRVVIQDKQVIPNHIEAVMDLLWVGGLKGSF